MQERKNPYPATFDVPLADPQIQRDYEASLGAFLVIFNGIENTVNEIIFLALQQSGREEILNHLSADSFRRKLAHLELISLAYPDALPPKMINELRDLTSHRNGLAHGHFHQNPFDGSYTIVTNKRERVMPIPQLVQLTERADRASDALRYSEAFFLFDDLDADGDAKDL